MFNQRLRIVALSIFFLLAGYSTYHFVSASFCTTQTTQTIQTIYGSVTVTEPVILELLASPAMERLKSINQYGIVAVVKPEQMYTRYVHSLGVFYILRTFGASLEEQVAGLLHDISHTAFSHVADFVHGTHLQKYSYQDEIFEWYLKETGLLAILQKHGLERIAQYGKGVEYPILKCDLPGLCADRIEYNIYGGYLEGWITQEQMRELVAHLHYQDGQWFFDDVASAKKYAKISVDLSVQNWSSAENAYLSTRAAQLLKQGFDKGIITKDDFHFSHDAAVLKKLADCKDAEIQDLIHKIYNHKTAYKAGTKAKHDLYFKGKFRGIDPQVKVDGQLIALSQLDSSYKEYMVAQHAACKEQFIVYT
ncbi:MAG: HD domain-containing protein [Candidatus Babeliales bacterium]|jgi:HD superfamily phosphohydrolase